MRFCKKTCRTDVTDLRRESKRKKGDVCILSVCFSTLENNYDGDFELTFIFHTTNQTKEERLTAYTRDRFTQGKISRKGDVCILSAFVTLGNDCDGEHELTVRFHTDVPTKEEQLTTPGDRQTVFDIFVRFSKGLPDRCDRFTQGNQGQKG